MRVADVSIRPNVRRSDPDWPPLGVAGRARAVISTAADCALVGAVIALPWSTSAMAVLLGCWALLALAAVGWRRLAVQFREPFAYLPALLWCAAAVGMLWAEASWSDALGGLRPYHKLLAMPLLFAHLRCSRAPRWIVFGFLGSCVLLLALSWLQLAFPTLVLDPSRAPGIPVKDRIVQGIEFTICGTALLACAIHALLARWLILCALCVAGALLFLANVFDVAATRTGAVLIPVLLGLIGWWYWRWRGLGALIGASVLIVSFSFLVSSAFRDRLFETASEIAQYEASNPLTSTGMRLDYWRQAVHFVAEAPIIGHGTGSTQRLSEQLTRNEQPAASVIIPGNPHNQVLAVAVQLGLLGALLLCAMWIAQWRLFLRAGTWPLVGALLVMQNVVGSLFNSHLFDVAPGWIYVIGVPALAALAAAADREFIGAGASRQKTRATWP